MKKNKTIFLISMFVIGLILIDQLSKIIVKSNCKQPIGNEWMGISLVENEGIAFGMHQGNTKNIILTTIILLIVINFIRNQKDRIDTKTGIALSFVLAGGVSNLLDRIIRGGVLDFIKIKHFAIFNLADCYIVIGWILLIMFLIQFSKQDKVGEKDCKKD